MFQLLIVDDEPSVVDTLAHTFPWQELDIEEVLCAYSGRQALELIKRHVIDIVITDIRMPGMDGLQLIEQIRKYSTSTQIIVLTGYEEFAYAKRALQLDAADYLLKPVSDASLTETIRKLTRKLTVEGEEAALHQRASQLLREHQPALKSELLVNLLEGSSYGEEDALPLIDIPFSSGDSVTLVLIRLEGQFAQYNRRDRLLIEYSIVNMAEETLGSFYQIWSCRDRHDYVVLTLGAKEASDDGEDGALLSRLCSQLQSHVSRFLHGDVSIVIGNPAVFPDGLAAGYQSVVQTMRRRIGKDVGLLMTVNDIIENQSVPILKTLHEPPSLIHLFEAGRWEEVGRKLSAVFDELDRVWNDSPELLAELYHAVAFACYHYAHTNGETLSQLFDRIGELDGLPDQAKLLSVNRMREWTFRLCRKLSAENTEDIRSSRATVVKQVKDYIHTHLADNVSLYALSDQVNLHPVYLSKIFKLETGEGIKEYSHRLRMEKAVHLIKHSDLKIYEITKEVGYLNTPYLIKVFKKEFGLTPQEYRDKHIAFNGFQSE
ncbi:response regulator [Paenibacillus sp. MBLB4367]|uniref:response regulator n=1 Tax=Paenibacillus sp. MBLB4367 TaxID=3384767 RepID=UPI003907EB18